MKAQRFSLAVLAVALLILAAGPVSGAEIPKSKQTTLNLYVTSAEAYQMWSKDKDNVLVIDCRTPEEYVFVGHATMAYNAPFKLNTLQWDAKKKSLKMIMNEQFVDAVKSIAKLDQTLLVMCRSGGRSAQSVNALAKAGFTRAYSIIDGFEGEKVSDKSSPDYGHRKIDGWVNSGSPWTYSCKKSHMLLPDGQ